MEPRARTTGAVYRDEAAELMAAAARRTTGPQQQAGGASHSRRPAAPFVEPDRRPLPYPEPIGVNDNPDGYVAERPRRRISIPRLLARILIAPLYLAVAVAAVAMILLFARSFFGI